MLFGNYSKSHFKYNLAKNPDTYWTFRQPNGGDESKMEKFMRRQPVSSDILARELTLTFDSTNLGVEEMGQPYVEQGLPQDIIEARILEMPIELIIELGQALQEFAGGAWGSGSKKEEAK